MAARGVRAAAAAPDVPDLSAAAAPLEPLSRLAGCGAVRAVGEASCGSGGRKLKGEPSSGSALLPPALMGMGESARAAEDEASSAAVEGVGVAKGSV